MPCAHQNVRATRRGERAVGRSRTRAGAGAGAASAVLALTLALAGPTLFTAAIPAVGMADSTKPEGADAGPLLAPIRRYVAEGLPVLVDVSAAQALASRSGEPLALELYEGDTLTPAATQEVRVGGRGLIDLSRLFPQLWADAASQPRAYYVQARIGEQQAGAPVVVVPLITPPRVDDALTTGVRRAAMASDGEALRSLQRLGAATRQRLQRTPVVSAPPEPVRNGVYVVVQHDLELSTTLGPLRIALRHDAAPMTARHIAELVDGGLYDGTTVHRVIAEDEQGLPLLIQFGDPSRTGAGDGGMYTPFEPSPLLHRFGTVSIAHPPGDFARNGSQLMICLGRDAGAELDGFYNVFGEVTQGVETLIRLEAVPVEPFDPLVSPAPTHRPVEPPVIERARLVESPPIGQRARAVVREDAPPQPR